MKSVLILNQTHPAAQPIRAPYCDAFFGRFRGLMLRKEIAPHEGLLMVQPKADRIDSAIHMFFMNFDIAVIWADAQMRVVDAQIARRWRPAYAPAKAARFILETHPDRLKDFQVGDQLDFAPCIEAS